MALEILVCIKQVPHPEHFSKIRLDPQSGRITREGVPAVVNPLDRNALEEALKNKESFSGRVTVISMGPPQAQSAIEEALATGADRGILLCDRAFGGADSLATAYALFYAVKKMGHFDLIYCGNETVDSGTSQVGPQLAELLNIPQVSGVQEVKFVDEKTLEVKRILEHGYLKARLKLPALLAVTKDINTPRLPTVMGIMEVAQKELKVWGANDVDALPENIGLKGSPTCTAGVCESKVERQREILDGNPDDVAKKAVQKLKDCAVI